ncbi:MAG: dTDP-4-dehydrorhamnose reductase [Halopseudomonas sp.]|uniref:dTDP-4-dehydrorhamnose reductase n=1 Tax=Halopseudomonas sp. TaxID=2901191 RepID=UPI0030037BC3
MRVLITGAGGQVGTELQRCAPAWVQITALQSAELDISDAAAVASCVEQLQPQLIINAAAYTAVDRAETEQAQALAVNQNGPENLARSAEHAGIPLFHISTDYVFKGDSQTAYAEQSETDPQTAYGRSKLKGEQAVMQLCSRHIVLRTSWVFSAQGGNFVKSMLRLAGERDQLRIVADQRGGPTSAAAIAKALWTLAAEYQQRQNAFTFGVFHFSGAPVVSWFEFAEHIIAQAAAMGLIDKQPMIEAIGSEEFPTPAPRPQFSALDCRKIHREHGIGQPDWKVDLSAVLAELAAG